jgi:hypothetical protein
VFKPVKGFWKIFFWTLYALGKNVMKSMTYECGKKVLDTAGKAEGLNAEGYQ